MGLSKSIRKTVAKLRGPQAQDNFEYLKRLEAMAGRADAADGAGELAHDGGHHVDRVLKIVDPARRIAFILEHFRDGTQKALVRSDYARYRGVLCAMETFALEGSTILDVGANIGAITLYCARLFGGNVRVLAFEPSPVVAPWLRRNVALNRAENVTVHECGLGAAAGSFDFHMERARSTNTGLSSFSAEARHKDAEVVKVPVRTVDSMRAEIGRVSIIKIDTQGTEREVLEGARALLREQRPAIVLEHEDDHFKEPASARKQLAALLDELRYDVFVVSKKDPTLGLRVNWTRPLRSDLIAIAR